MLVYKIDELVALEDSELVSAKGIVGGVGHRT
jgi:hypothetical protein